MTPDEKAILTPKNHTHTGHDHVCPSCLEVWWHNILDCRIRDGSAEARCTTCLAG